MKKSNFFATLALGLFLFASCSQDEVLNEVAKTATVSTRSTEEAVTGNDYKVDYLLLQKYLKLTKKDVNVQSVTPFVREGDTLAYCVQYTQGWDVISGDQRLSPTMMASDNGVFSESILGVEELLEYIISLRTTTEGEKNTVWDFLTEKSLSNTTFSTRTNKYTVGMWRAQDTIYESNSEVIQHIITTQWGQSYPWNEYTPLDNGEYTPTGCVANAVGQVIYHYRKDNPYREIPTVVDTVMNGNTKFSNYTLSGWDLMEKDTWQIAKFLAYIGDDIMGLTYQKDNTTGYPSDVIEALNYFGFTYTKTTAYNFSTILSSLQSNHPIIIFSTIKDEESGHAFIVDRYKIQTDEIYLNCVWDPNYVVSEEEYYANPPEMFIETADGGDKVFILKQMEDTYWGMNWGWNGTDNDVFYAARHYVAPFEDEAGSSPGMDVIYTVSWPAGGYTMNGVTSMFYNIIDNQNNS